MTEDRRRLGDMDPQEFRREAHRLVDWVADYFSSVELYPVLARVQPGDIQSALPAEAPERGESFDQILSDFERVLIRQFDWLYRESESAPRVMAISIHPFIAGVPHWIGALDAALEHIVSRDGVWRATGSEIIDHFALMVEDE